MLEVPYSFNVFCFMGLWTLKVWDWILSALSKPVECCHTRHPIFSFVGTWHTLPAMQGFSKHDRLFSPALCDWKPWWSGLPEYTGGCPVVPSSCWFCKDPCFKSGGQPSTSDDFDKLFPAHTLLIGPMSSDFFELLNGESSRESAMESYWRCSLESSRIVSCSLASLKLSSTGHPSATWKAWHVPLCNLSALALCSGCWNSTWATAYVLSEA